jgi:hypothetical protein
LAAAPDPAVASHSQVTFFEAPQQLLNSQTRRATIRQLASLGVKALRVELHWRDVAPSPTSPRRPRVDRTNPASYAWGAYDAVLGEASRLGWQILLTVTAPAPKWATAAHRDYITRPNPRDFKEFMTAVGRRYGSIVSEYALWNEPNIPGWLMPQFNSNGSPASPAIYRALYLAGYAGVTAADPTAKVLFGETSPFGVSHLSAGERYQVVAPLTFMREALCLNTHYRKRAGCARVPMYGYAHHPYTYPRMQGPYYRPSNFDQVTIGSLDRLSSALDAAARAHAIPAHVPIFLTEFGVQSQPNNFGVSLSEQVEYQATSEKIAWGNPRVRSFCQYLYRDETPRNGLRGYRTGLVAVDGGRKPLYYSFPVPVVVNRSGSGYHLWGFVRPSSGATRVRVLVQGPGSRSFRRLALVSTDSRGYWQLRSSTPGTHWRTSWRSQTGQIYNGPGVGVS